MIRAVLFDVDGVLLDSDDCLVELYGRVFESMGLQRPTRQEVLKYSGSTARGWIRNLLPKASEEELDLAMKSTKACHSRIRSMQGVMPHARVVLRELRRRGIKIAIVTNQQKFGVTFTLERIGIGFDAVASLSRGLKPKPAPDLLFKALKRLKVRPAEVLYVGDTIFDVKAGAAAGVRTVILSHGRNRDLQAERILSLKDLLGVVSNG